ncbi:MAG: hypothetical protein COB88_04385 [Flavobacteriales bacterium]|nr:MAG: hypothetical protein COB88_04385 [Flavobacteriales bacterium]
MRRIAASIYVLLLASNAFAQPIEEAITGTIAIKRANNATGEGSNKGVDEAIPTADTIQVNSMGTLAQCAKRAGVYTKRYDDVISFEYSIEKDGLYSTIGIVNYTNGWITRGIPSAAKRKTILFSKIQARREDGQIIRLPGFSINMN